MSDRTRNDANGVKYLEKDLGAGVYAPAIVPVDTSGVPLSDGSLAAITISDGGDVAEGTTADAAVTTNAAGTVSAKLRGLVALARKGSASSPANVGVTDAAAQLLASNSNRLVAYFQNCNAADPMYIGKDNTVTATNGIRVAAGEMFTADRGTGAWYAICASGKTADARVLEFS